MKLNLLFFGSLDLYDWDFIPFLSHNGYNVTVIDTSGSYYPLFPQLYLEPGNPIFKLYKNRTVRFAFKNDQPRAYLVKSVSDRRD